MRVPVALYAAALCLCVVPAISAQDAAKVDPKHYTVGSENDQVRILRVHYGPHEKSVMHSHPDEVAVFLTDTKGTFTYPDGKKEIVDLKAGTAEYGPATVHLPENTSDQGFDVIVIELKGKAAKGAMGCSDLQRGSEPPVSNYPSKPERLERRKMGSVGILQLTLGSL